MSRVTGTRGKPYALARGNTESRQQLLEDAMATTKKDLPAKKNPKGGRPR
jgi:hypothetical protein